MSFLRRLVRRMSGGDAAERAELAGDLERAIRLWVAAGENDEAARVMVVRGDGEPSPTARLQHYAQAAATATPGAAIETSARAKKARLVLALAKDGVASAARRQDLVDAAADLLRGGEALLAAEAYALAGDTEGEARALTQAGEVDRLEELLTRDQTSGTKGRLAHEVHADIDALMSTGQRREALALAEASPDDPAARSRATRLRGAQIVGNVVRVTRNETRFALVLGAEITIGRVDATLSVPSSALSRKHARLWREGGRVLLSDLGSRNGTQLRGQTIPPHLDVTDGATLTLGGEITLDLAPSATLPGAVDVEVGGERYVVPLGDARLGVASWRVVSGADGWVELVTEAGNSAFANGMALALRITLLRGDAFAATRVGNPVLRIDE